MEYDVSGCQNNFVQGTLIYQRRRVKTCLKGEGIHPNTYPAWLSTNPSHVSLSILLFLAVQCSTASLLLEPFPTTGKDSSAGKGAGRWVAAGKNSGSFLLQSLSSPQGKMQTVGKVSAGSLLLEPFPTIGKSSGRRISSLPPCCQSLSSPQ